MGITTPKTPNRQVLGRTPALDYQEALARMQRRKTDRVQWTFNGWMIVEYRLIPEREARNYDGSPAPGDGDKTILQRKVTRPGARPRYTNWW